MKKEKTWEIKKIFEKGLKKILIKLWKVLKQNLIILLRKIYENNRNSLNNEVFEVYLRNNIRIEKSV